MNTSTNKKTWSKPAITSLDRMQNAANGTHNGLSKGPTTSEYDYNGPGS